MEELYVHKPPLWYSIFVVGAFIYNVWIAAEFLNGFALPDIVTAYLPFDMPSASASASFGLPAWAMAAYWAAILGGGIGCLAMLVGTGLAVQSLCLALVGTLVSKFFELTMFLKFDVDLSQAMVSPVLHVIVAGACVCLAFWAQFNGWLE